jgi:hypothetical protein
MKPSDVERLIAISPSELNHLHRYQTVVEWESEASAIILDLLHASGFTKWNGRGRATDTEYTIYFIRHYDASDLESAELLTPALPWPESVEIWKAWRDDQPHALVVAGLDMFVDRDIHVTVGGQLLLPDRTKRILETSGLVGLSFEQVVVDPDGSNPFNERKKPRQHIFDEAPYWLIQPTVKMPPLSPTMDLRGPKSVPMEPGDPEACYVSVREGDYNRAEFHYRRVDVEAMPLFDVAETIEKIMFFHRSIVSPRFYRFCVDHNIEGHWAPVRLDESRQKDREKGHH